MPPATKQTHLNLGCGRSAVEFPNWTNLDSVSHPGVDDICDLENCLGSFPSGGLPYASDRFTHLRASHVLEHIRNILPLMQECWRVSQHGAEFLIRVPYGSSDSADEDPTHVRRFFRGSFGYFSQAAYGGASYGYLGDWSTAKIALRLKPGFAYSDWHSNLDALVELIDRGRNIVDEMIVQLRAVKPIRIAGTFVESSPLDFIFPPEISNAKG